MVISGGASPDLLDILQPASLSPEMISQVRTIAKSSTVHASNFQKLGFKVCYLPSTRLLKGKYSHPATSPCLPVLNKCLLSLPRPNLKFVICTRLNSCINLMFLAFTLPEFFIHIILSTIEFPGFIILYCFGSIFISVKGS